MVKRAEMTFSMDDASFFGLDLARSRLKIFEASFGYGGHQAASQDKKLWFWFDESGCVDCIGERYAGICKWIRWC